MKMKMLLLAALVMSFTAQARLYKVDTKGVVIPDTSQSWQCVYDDSTQLLWENPTTATLYQWPSDQHVSQTNGALLCGYSVWRLPTVKELETLIVCPKGRGTSWVDNYRCNEYQTDGLEQQTHKTYFPGVALSYWTAESYIAMPTSAYFVNFLTGETDRDAKFNPNRAMLVIKPAGFDVNPRPVVAAIQLPKWNPALSTLEIPQFDATSPIKSCKMKLDLNNYTFQVLEVK